MSLVDDIYGALLEAGKQLKTDLWTPSDLDLLRHRSRDLMGLEYKAQQCQDPSKKSQYQLAGKLVIDQVKMLALSRLYLGQKDIFEILERLFGEVLTKYLQSLLPQLLGRL